MSSNKLEEMLENAREEMFNLRFQKASARLENVARLKQVRREVAQLQNVLHMRKLAAETAAQEPQIAAALAGKEWSSVAHFDYEETAWRVTFSDSDNNELASALVDLNRKRPQGRAARQVKEQPRLVKRFEVAG
ncbi:MAG: 50S ribosomal protein L29 [Anaerolineales bacterium]|nr:50S ribosomal protein L29 [Anaerolineales bacterium]